MHPRAPKLLEDIRSAADFVKTATDGLTLQQFTQNHILRQAVERNFEIIGEAMRRLEKDDPDGLRIVDKSNWIGKALVFPRALLPQVKARPGLAQAGVCLLLEPRPDSEGDMLYVGEGDSIRPRLESHYA